MHCSGMLACLIFPTIGNILKHQVCYDDVGCFSNRYPWRSITLRERRHIPPPQSPRDVGVTVTFFARNIGPAIDDGHMVNLRGRIYFNDRDFDAGRNKTFFIIHGFIDERKADWLRTMKDELLKKEDANVFIVDWGRGLLDLPHYQQAVSNTRVAGAELARFIKLLNSKYNLQPGNIHLIGHSLGAHVASYAAKESMRGRIGRITGLDPAQPGFEGTPKEVRLDRTDALFVDVYHTNMRPFFPLLGFGMIDPVGDVDVYYNGGYNQPGCGVLQNVQPIHNIDDIRNLPNNALLTCSHLRAHEYFTASINSKGCDVWAGEVKLPDKNSIKSVTFGRFYPVTSLVKKCSLDTCTIAGYKADTPGLPRKGVFAATTLRVPPFCDPGHGGMIVDKNILNKMERYTEASTEEEPTIKIPSEIPQVATMENDDMDELADDFMSTSKSGSQYFNEDDLYEIVTK